MTKDQEKKPPNIIDASFIERKREHSRETFGEQSFNGALDHLITEISEIRDAPNDVTEWADALLLTLDGAWRAGHEPQAIIDAVHAKQARNEARVWPDKKTADPEKAILHVKEIPEQKAEAFGLVRRMEVARKDRRGKSRPPELPKIGLEADNQGLPSRDCSIFKDRYSNWYILVHDKHGMVHAVRGTEAEAKRELNAYATTRGYKAPREFVTRPPNSPELQAIGLDVQQRITQHRIDTGDWQRGSEFAQATADAKMVQGLHTNQPELSPMEQMLYNKRQITNNHVKLDELQVVIDAAPNETVRAALIREYQNLSGANTQLKQNQERLVSELTATGGPTEADVNRAKGAYAAANNDLHRAYESLLRDPADLQARDDYLVAGQRVVETHNELQLTLEHSGMSYEDHMVWDRAQVESDLGANLSYAPPTELLPDGPETGMMHEPSPLPDYEPQPSEEVPLGQALLNDPALGPDYDHELGPGAEFGVGQPTAEHRELSITGGMESDMNIILERTADGRYQLRQVSFDEGATFDTRDQALALFSDMEQRASFPMSLELSPEVHAEVEVEMRATEQINRGNDPDLSPDDPNGGGGTPRLPDDPTPSRSPSGAEEAAPSPEQALVHDASREADHTPTEAPETPRKTPEQYAAERAEAIMAPLRQQAAEYGLSPEGLHIAETLTRSQLVAYAEVNAEALGLQSNPNVNVMNREPRQAAKPRSSSPKAKGKGKHL